MLENIYPALGINLAEVEVEVERTTQLVQSAGINIWELLNAARRIFEVDRLKSSVCNKSDNLEDRLNGYFVYLSPRNC
jgi:hypothetical protein